MAWTQADLDALKRAIATGALKVRYADGREVTYRTLKEMRAIYDLMAHEVIGRSRRVTLARFTRN